MINYICIISMIFAKMSQKLRFLSTSLSLVGWIGLILLTLIGRVDSCEDWSVEAVKA